MYCCIKSGAQLYPIDPARLYSQHGLNGLESFLNFSKFKKYARSIRKLVSKTESWTNLDVLPLNHKAWDKFEEISNLKRGDKNGAYTKVPNASVFLKKGPVYAKWLGLAHLTPKFLTKPLFGQMSSHTCWSV